MAHPLCSSMDGSGRGSCAVQVPAMGRSSLIGPFATVTLGVDHDRTVRWSSVASVAATTFVSMPEDTSSASGRGRYPERSLEFERVAFFSDAIFAISMTLLVRGPRRAHDRQRDEQPASCGRRSATTQSEIIMFFISFAVLGASGCATTATSAGSGGRRPADDRRQPGLPGAHRLPAVPVGRARQYSDNAVGRDLLRLLHRRHRHRLGPLERDRHPPRPLHHGQPTPEAVALAADPAAILPAAFFLATMPVAVRLRRRPRSTAGSCCIRSSALGPATHAEARRRVLRRLTVQRRQAQRMPTWAHARDESVDLGAGGDRCRPR